MPDSAGKAVFLSYASQDAEPAKRICETLRAAGIEVWFDQSELVGGDAWDRKIREQISACVLFLPVISANTEARKEGYFRLEWKLAEDRSHLMAKGVPFIVPVTVDGTSERGALVPDAFTAVQWTRLPRGDTPPIFVTRVQRLLSGSINAPPSPGTSQPIVVAPARRVTHLAWATTALGLVAVGLLAFVLLRPTGKEAANVPDSAAATKARVVPPSTSARVVSDKSIAVLPFANRSPDKENEFFTDGVHEDILTNLFNIRDLRVVSRTSVEQYRGTKKSIKEIGAELGVAYILEGSVRRAGDQVHVTGQLIDTRTDHHLWAKAYNEKLSDIFAIQAAIAKAIAAELKTMLSPQETSLVERRPTANPAAYDLYLKAREISRTRFDGLEERQALLQEALGHDPNFARAWSELALVRNRISRVARGPDDPEAAHAKAAVDAAVRLAPDAPETLLCLGDYYYRVRRDFVRALEYLERMGRMQPNDPEVFAYIGFVQRRQGRWIESTHNLRKAVKLDPTNLTFVGNLAQSLRAGRRFEELIGLYERFPDAVSIRPRIVPIFGQGAGMTPDLAYIRFLFTGSTREMEAALARLSPAESNSAEGIDARKRWARLTGDFAEAIRLDRLQPYFGPARKADQAASAALTLLAHGDRAGARARLEEISSEVRASVAAEPANEDLWGLRARVELALGNNDEAVRCAHKAVELLPESVDASAAPVYRRVLASVYAWTGDPDRAITELAHVLRTPTFVGSALWNVHELKRSPEFFPLRGDPRFESLISDPKSNAPLF